MRRWGTGTACNGFPRVLSLLARDGDAPRIFMRLGDRLAYSNGVVLLSIAAALVFVAFGGLTGTLIPLYAIGVFLAFTLSQTGMVLHWWRLRNRHWRKSLCFNAVGGLLSAAVFITAGVSKFTSGAWVAIIAIGLFLLVTTWIGHHYDTVRAALRLHSHAIELPAHGTDGALTGQRSSSAAAQPAGPTDGSTGQTLRTDGEGEDQELPEEIRDLSVVAVSALDLAAMRTLAYAASLQQPVLTVHISLTEEEARGFRDYWTLWGDHLPLEIVTSPYPAVVAPLVNYLEALHRQNPDLTLTVILPETTTQRRRHQLLHNRTLRPRRSPVPSLHSKPRERRCTREASPRVQAGRPPPEGASRADAYCARW
ncbi:amino acid permease [Streptomyces anulatus]